MSRIWCSVAAIAISLSASALPASANTVFTMGSGILSAPSSTGFSNSLSGGAFWDDYNFTLASASAITITFAGYDPLSSNNFIAPFSIEMFSGSSGSTSGAGLGTAVPGLIATETVPPAVGVPETISFTGLLPTTGPYYLEVSGTCTKSCSYGGTMDLVVNTTSTEGGAPLPAALPLFASGLGLMGFWSRRRKKAKAV